MENSKKVRHAAICPDCRGNGYIKAVLDEGRVMLKFPPYIYIYIYDNCEK